MAIRTVYETFNPDKNFYSVERSGYVTVGELLFAMTNDMLRSGGFSVVNVVFTDSSTNSQNSGTWPVTERIFRQVSKGTGYNVGDTLTMYDGNATVTTKYGITINSISDSGAITGFTPTASPKYTSVDTTQPRPMGYAPTAGGDIDETIRNGAFTNQLEITSNVGVTSYVAPAKQSATVGGWTSAGVATSPTWIAKYGVNGSGFLADGSAAPNGSRWPTGNLIFTFQSDIQNKAGVKMTTPTSSHLASVKVGQEIFARPDELLAGTSIPPGTIITKKVEIPAIVNGTYFTDETTAKAYYFVVSNPVSLARGQIVSVRGTGATFRNDILGVPDKWKVVLNSTGAVDPLSDPAGVLGNVKVATTNSNIAIINALDTINAFDPRIWPGHRVTSVLQNGALQNTVVYVKDVLSANISHAKVELTTNVSLPQGEPLRFVFEDPQDWRIKLEVTDKQTAQVSVGTELQIPDSGEHAYLWNDAGTAINDISGLVGAAPTKTPLTGATTGIEVDPTKIEQGFINRKVRIGAGTTNIRAGNPESYPMNYTMTIADRGIYFGVWESNWSVIQKPKNTTDVFFSWVLIQRPVDRITGRILTTGRCPLFCINSVGNQYWKFIVREADAQHPTQGDPNTRSYQVTDDWKVSERTTPFRTPADAHTEDSFGIINSTKQIALTEDSKFLISFLHNLTTPRFRYSEELDMIGQTSADVCMATNDISITAYQESGPRTYRAMPANNPYNTGLRVAVLKNIPVKPDTPVQ